MQDEGRIILQGKDFASDNGFKVRQNHLTMAWGRDTWNIKKMINKLYDRGILHAHRGLNYNLRTRVEWHSNKRTNEANNERVVMKWRAPELKSRTMKTPHEANPVRIAELPHFTNDKWIRFDRHSGLSCSMTFKTRMWCQDKRYAGRIPREVSITREVIERLQIIHMTNLHQYA